MITERTDRGMDVMEELLGKYQIRKSRAQKEAFSGFVEGLCEKWGYPFQAEEGTNLIRCRNLVAGDPEKAEFICTAHYDTCALMPIPNFITPKNPLVFLLYQLMIVGIVFCLAFSAAYLAGRLGGGMLGSMLAAYAVAIPCCAQILAGYPNKHTANDNTSGVAVLLDAMERLPQECRGRVAFVFFDGEELGMLGSGLFRKQHKALAKEKLLLNFDCVSDGDQLLFIQGKKVKEDPACPRLQEIMAQKAGNAGKSVEFVSSRRAIYPSDQMGFKKGVGIAAMRKAPIIGLYMGRIHTLRDVVFRRENIHCLADGVVALAEALNQG